MLQQIVHPFGPHDLEDAGLVFATFQSIDTIAEGDSLYLNASGRVAPTLANASATMHSIGVAFRGAASGDLVKVVVFGQKSAPNYNASGFIGLDAFVSAATAGRITGTAPAASGNIAQVIGRWFSGSGLLVQVSRGRQRNELAGSV
jgi:hypothetical protein